MKISESLLRIAEWFEDPNNPVLVSADEADAIHELIGEEPEMVNKLAKEFVSIASIIKEAANKADRLQASPETLQKMASLASKLDESGDEFLQSQADVIDEWIIAVAESERDKLYGGPGKKLDEVNGVNEAIKAVEKSPIAKKYEPLEMPLSARYDPNHPGIMLKRIENGVYQSPLDGKIFNFNEGFTMENGNKIPGGEISANIDEPEYVSRFDTRADRMQNK